MMKRALAIAKFLLATLAGAVALWVLAVIALLVLPSSCTSRRPPDAELLQRHLGLDPADGFQCIEVKYRPAREWSVWIYLKGSPERLSRLLAGQRFGEGRTIQTNEVVDLVAFGSAHLPSSLSGAKAFGKRSSEDLEWHYALLSADGTQLWLWVPRF